uniref:Sushi domain-containing protein n=1 Tax=Meleagris gallopavo TaxID=9103 RepID=A0A803Y7Z2_MELGA
LGPCRLILDGNLELSSFRQRRCPVPHIENGRSTPSHYIYRPGDVVRFTCNTGYNLQGSHTSICQADFSWSPPLPACKKGKCSPPNIANGLHSSQSTNKFLPGAVVHYSCKDGFKLVGNVSISCSDVGRWSRPLPRCQEVTCPPPPNIANGLHSSRSSARFPHGTVVYYSCKDGFELVGNVSISCLDVGRWSRPLPRCQGGWRQPCGHCCSVPAGCGPALTTISMFLQPSAARVPQCTMGRCRH